MKFPLTSVFLLTVLLFGCAAKPQSIVGSWHKKNPGSPGNDVTYIFKLDGTYTYEQHVSFESIHSHQFSSGKYTITPSILTLTTTSEIIGLDPADMAAIDAREAKEHPHLHIQQDSGDISVKIEQPTTTFLYTFNDDEVRLKDVSNAADHGVDYVRTPDQ